MMKSVSHGKAEKGQVLLGALLSLPVLALLCAAAMGTFFFFMEAAERSVAQMELEAEVSSAMQRIAGDMKQAERLLWLEPDHKIIIYRKSTQGFMSPKIYWLREKNGVKTLIEGNDARNPMTGASLYSKVNIEEFSCREVRGKRGLWKIVIEGKSYQTGQTYRAATEIFLRREGT